MIDDETKEYYDELLTFSLELASKFTAMERIKEELVELDITDERIEFILNDVRKAAFIPESAE
ncbi:UNVERIFIED_ORG: hypothetical protein GGI61_002497 [Rhizobium esperanzae]